MLVEPGFQVCHPLVELRDLLLLELNQHPNGGRCGHPIDSGYAWWRLISIHRDKIHGSGSSVNHPAGGIRRRSC